MAKNFAYRPSIKTSEAQKYVYESVETMFQERDLTRVQFNGPDGNRSLTQYIDDNDRRIAGYRPTKEEQGKEDWQNNIFDNKTRIKLKAFCAGIALQIPEQTFKAVNAEGIFSAQRAEGMRQLVRHSRIVEDNPQLQTFFEAWDMLAKGTVIKYDGYRRIKHKRKFVTGFTEDGEVEFEEKEVISEDRCIDVQVPLSEFLIWDFNIFDVQGQPRVAWIQHYDGDQLEMEFQHLPNYKFVKDKATVGKFKTSTSTHFYDKWKNRVKETNDYEVIRYYSITEDRYEVWVNGVDLLRAPMLWGRKKKRYPFAKSIREPMTGKEFFYGMALPHELEGNQDANNTLWNTTLDKALRSLVPPILVGMANKDLLDLEDEYVNQDNKFYVPDVTQVKPMPFLGVTSSDTSMIQMVQRGIDLASSDATQSGIAGRGNVTAREIVIADENARKLKGITFMFLEDLHLQKTRNRINTILMNYMTPQYETVIGKDGNKVLQEAIRTFNIDGVKLSDGSTGTLAVRIAKNADKLPTPLDIEATEKAMADQGLNYKMIAHTTSYYDDWEFDFSIVPESLYAQDKVKKEAVTDEKLARIARYFPEYFAANKEALFGELLSIYGDSVEKYTKPQPPQVPEGSGEVEAEPGSPLDMGAIAAAMKQ
jgi:hypothetical protein